ncbi:GGDEF domain-containing protein [Actinoplanes sp. NEAU-A12]|uniref:GGDEF domain-containing protein n=1 Tax=Actinoplanes sandaracinus TaxID=3045177 RepID=A0ABT6WII3_9ACTN|nr:GGDEF domain-containing protein [Actinoplanes sandaracinus]MDI6099542.1 GGDEF domain-containing protein [Actinoplanes sandaracinus]
MSPWQFRAYLAAGTFLALLYILGGEVTRAVVYGTAGVCAWAAILTGVRRQRPRPAAAWWLILAAVQASTTGDLVMGLRTWLFPDSTGLLGAESMIYLLSYPLLAAALTAIVRSRSEGRDRGVAIDSAIVACALGLPLWLVAVAPVLSEPGQPVGILLLRLAFPLGDVALLTLLARLLAGGGTRNVSLCLLLAAVCGWLAGDVVNAVLAERGALETYWGGALYCLSYTAFGAAALHPSMPGLTTAAGAPASRLTTRRLTVLAGLSLLAPVLLLGQALTGRQVQAVPVGVACVVLFLLVVARMAGLTRQVERQARELADLAARDGLTGVGNRRAWDVRLLSAVTAAHRTGQPLTVALLDLDHFKRFNDTYGHQAGDHLLKGAAAAWLDVLRRDDVLYRYGGEEFGLILPGAGGDDALRLVERLGEVVPSGQSFSAGIASLDGAETPDDLVARADAALYRAKADGRARARLATAA